VLPAVPLVVPEVPLALPLPLGELPIRAFFRTNLSLALDPVALLVDPVALVPLAVPEVPVEPPDIESPLCRHPVTVMLLLLWLEQVEATIRTDSTRRCCPLELDIPELLGVPAVLPVDPVEGVPAVAPEEPELLLSRRPRTSTWCPTWGRSSLELPSSM